MMTSTQPTTPSSAFSVPAGHLDPLRSATVFDRLYDEYLPFRLYADYMLGKTPAVLAKQFGLSEQWVSERIEAIRLCLGKQVRLNLLGVDPLVRQAAN
jgi:hypothetical protein